MTLPPGRDAFVASLERAWEVAAAAAGSVEDRDFELAGLRLRLRFAGTAMVAPLTAAIAHAARATGGSPALTVLVFDSESTGSAMPPPPWPRDAFGPHGCIDGWFDDELQATYHWGSGSLSVLLPTEGRAVFWSRSASRFPSFERAAPLRTMLHGWTASRGLQLTHAAAVAGPAGCVLLAGPSGAGKSSTALACLGSKLGHLSDDFCLVEAGEPAVAHALYSSVKAFPDTLARLGLPGAMVDEPVREDGDKAVVFLHRHRPEALVASAPVRAVVVPRIAAGRDSRVVPATPGEALAALAASTMLQLPGQGADALRGLSRVVRGVACHGFEVGSDPGQVPVQLGRLVA